MSETLQYKGYDGLVLYSAEDKLLFGHIAGIRDMVTYEGTDVQSLETNFHAAIDEYLAFCKETGKTPDTPFKGTFNVRVGPDLHKRAALLAESRKTKLNTVVQQALEEYLSQAS
jgi:predicted HicB family RNase H-like nuclease